MTRSNLVLILRLSLLGVVCFLVLYPLGMLVYSSFREAMPGLPSLYSLKGYIDVYLDPSTYRVIWTTVWIAVLKAILSVGLAIFFCWVVHRTNCAARRLIDVILHLNFFLLPPLPVIIGWVLILAPNSGIVNVWFASVFGRPLFNIFSSWGIIFVMISFGVSVYYVFLAPSFMAMDATMEEAAMTSGASGFATVRKVVLPLLAPGILATMLLSFIQGMEMFAAPLFLGVPANIEVMSTKIFFYIQSIPPDYTAATAMAVMLLVITSFLVFVQWRILGHREFVTITGKGYGPRPMDLGRWRWPVFGIAAMILFTFTVPPFIVLIQTTFMKVAGVYLPGMYTLSNYTQVFQRPDILDALKNTVILGVVAATAGTVICTLVSYVVVRTRFRERRVLDFVTWLPFSVAAIVLSLAFLWAYIYLPLPFGITLYGTLAILVLIVITKNLPIGVKTMGSGIIQVSPQLEESAWVHGASWTQTLLRIWVPLLKNSLQSVWIILFCFATTDLASLILLYSPSSRVLATVFYEYWEMGNVEVASVVGLLQAGIIIVGYVVVKLLGRWLGGVKEMA